MNRDNRTAGVPVKYGDKIFSPSSGRSLTDFMAGLARPLVVTNGCFDILHRGHVSYLQTAATLGSSLVVGINSDDSVRRQGKAPDRPINPLEDRMAVIAALESVDAVVPFDESTPLELVHRLRPDILVKGGDWAIPDIIGGREVESWGGTVHSIQFEFPRSTSNLINRIREQWT